jgi:hypothetical protein
MSFAGYTADQNIEEYIDENFQVFIDDKILKLSDVG